MAKIKNRILIILALVMLCAVGLFALSACGGNRASSNNGAASTSLTTSQS